MISKMTWKRGTKNEVKVHKESWENPWSKKTNCSAKANGFVFCVVTDLLRKWNRFSIPMKE